MSLIPEKSPKRVPNRLPLSKEQLEKASKISPTIEALQKEIKNKNLSLNSITLQEESTQKAPTKSSQKNIKFETNSQERKLERLDITKSQSKTIKASEIGEETSKKVTPSKNSFSFPMFNLIHDRNKNK